MNILLWVLQVHAVKAFHDEILNGGPLPLDLLEERVDGWIKAATSP
jgi:uncharacterized protein (DUF885 family)